MTAPILVLGAGGRLGRVLVARGGSNVVGLDHQTLDIAHPSAVAEGLETHRPGAVINAAAMAAVDACETDFAAAVRSNAEGPAVVARACAACDIPFIHVSTDYVFGGEGHDRPRREGDPPSPINAYGRSKRMGEEEVLGAQGRSVIVRTAWLFGFPMDFVDRMARKAAQGERLRITEQTGAPTPVGPLAGSLLRFAERLAKGAPAPPILHLAGSPVTTRAAWVERALAAAAPGLAAIERVSGDAFAGTGAARPLGTPLDSRLAAELFDLRIDWRPAADAYRLEWRS
jgi:dTDP-4-dehydrorhamnose reductase